jgi:Reverse transcriptase (RNA-dependent DNA polymerase)/Group II intron, maturase-specific domain
MLSMRPRQELLQRLRDHGGQRPPRRGGMRTDPRDERHRQLDGEHRGRGGHRNMSGPAGALHIAVRLPGRTAEPAGQLSRGVGCRHPRVQQVRGGVDPLSEHVTTSASATGRPTNRHVTNILLDMSHRRTDTPRQFDTPIAQRHLKAEVANCVGGVISPLLANVFMHYAFDAWMVREFPGCPFARFADDIVAHCDSEDQARALRDSIATRLGALGLELHPEKTKVVFCQDANRPGAAEHTSFDFLGYTFRGRLAKGRRGYFVSFAPAISVKAAKAVGQKVRAWHLNRRSGTDLSGLAEEIDPQVRGWIGYYGAFYRSELYSLARHIDEHLVRWAMQKFKRLRGKAATARAWLDAVRQHQPRLFAHWHLLPPTGGRPVGAV